MSGGGIQTAINPVDALVSKGLQTIGVNKPISDIAAGGPYFQQAGATANGLTSSGSTGNGLPSTLPNLGPQTLIPQMRMGGAFHPPNQQNGPYNAMAARNAGSLFQPSLGASIYRLPAVPSIPAIPAVPAMPHLNGQMYSPNSPKGAAAINPNFTRVPK